MTSRGKEHDFEPEIDYIDITCSGWIGENMGKKLTEIEKDIIKIMKKHGYEDIAISWRN